MFQTKRHPQVGIIDESWLEDGQFHAKHNGTVTEKNNCKL
jgi:hypothetical protein